MATDTGLLGTVAIVGFPNVGKSTLVNRLTGTRAAVVHETSGVTRDRKELVVEWTGRRFLLVDTGGVDIADETPITRSIADQAREAVAEADLVLFVVDAKLGITPGDEEVAQILRESHKPVLVIANKIDDPRQEPLALELHAARPRRPDSDLRRCTATAPATCSTRSSTTSSRTRRAARGVPDEAIRVAILGRPNVGKSIAPERAARPRARDRLGDSRARRATRSTPCSSAATARSCSSTPPGLRRKRKHRQGIEYYSELRALEAAERADVALVLIDTTRGRRRPGPRRRRRRAQGRLLDAGRALEVGRRRPSASRTCASGCVAGCASGRRSSPISALTGRGLERLLDTVDDALRPAHGARPDAGAEPTSSPSCAKRRQPPSRGGKRLNLLYGTQVQTRPPRFRIFVNDPTLVTRDYGYWVENELRERFGLDGVPVSIDFVRRT